MAIPWLRVLDAVLSLSDLARGLNRRRLPLTGESGEGSGGGGALATGGAGGAPLEARFAGVVVAALKEAFDRDSQRIQAEREQREVERRRAERLLKIELLRQAGERELGRLRLVATLAMASWLGTIVLAAFVTLTIASRITLGVGWALLLGALAAALAAQSTVSNTLARVAEQSETDPGRAANGGDTGAAATWLLVAGLAVAALAVLLR